ncbi:MAG: thioredoxin family protein [Candidatus Pedobacter colombiensis]|uniref:Thioredoxin family protein n=1 Tax=Candidatus Pedobacter colombiensis TaxID=3121371 RepID=A0AAJ5W587_9SPHI|nr:thioredoxin family protein [Pedobacter sp.]WEK17501.1 MAG: thioredoxin family protein [Pedobacter sp.]
MQTKKILLSFLLLVPLTLAYGAAASSIKPVYKIENNATSSNNYYPKVTDLKAFLKQSNITIILFNAHWSGPGKIASAKFKALATKYNDKKANFGVIDIDVNEEDVKVYASGTVPTVIVFANGSSVKSFTGGKAIKLDLESYLSSYILQN